MKCPGQDMRYWKPGDIFNAKCPKCCGTVEFFKDEVRRKCHCGQVVTNPKLDFGCAEWCAYAEQCMGAIPEEVKAKQKAEKENSLREKIALEMKRYFGKDVKRIDHALMVAHHAEEIIKREGGDPLVILGSAFLHDIGLSKGQEDDHFQETEGPSITREILERLGIKKEPTEEICDIIGHHHHPREKETLNFQILYEADWLVNMKEKGLPREEVQAVIEKSFKTEAGRRLAEELFLS